MSVSVLQFQRDGNRLLVSLIEGATRVDSRPFEDAQLLETWANSYVELMERALAFPLSDHRPVLIDFGRCLYDNLLSGDLGEALRARTGQTMIVDLPESLLWLPVEVLYDGEEFLGTRHSLGRRITSWEGSRPRRSAARRDGHGKPAFLLVAGHAEDDIFFEETRRELYDLCGMIGEAGVFELHELKVDNSISRSELMRAISASDYIHFSGHSESAGEGQAGWVFEDFRFTPDDVAALGGCDPYFVFSNSCRSSSVTNWRELRDMVRAFWERGTQHFIGANTRIHYKRAAEFGEAFYREFLTGQPIGESVRRARQAVLDNPTHHDPCWLAYVLYGDPSFRLDIRQEAAEAVANHEGACEREPDGEPLAALARGPGAAAGTPTAPAPARPGYLRSSWTGKEIPASTAVTCSHPGCSAAIGLDGQLQQRRARLDLMLHRPELRHLASGRQEYFCPAHLPKEISEWLSDATAANAAVLSGQAVCAWTGRAASRSEILSKEFVETPHGLMSPEAREKYSCSETGTIIPPEMARAGRGFIVHLGKTFCEDAYWRRLGVAERPAIDREAALALEREAREAVRHRLKRLERVEIDDRTHGDVQLGPNLRESEEEWAALLNLPGSLFRGGLVVGILHRAVLHEKHYQRFGHDRAPAGLEDIQHLGRFIQPLSKATMTLAILSSPTGWTEEAREHVRRLEPGKVTLLLKNSGRRPEPLAFNKASSVAEALKLDLAGGIAAA